MLTLSLKRDVLNVRKYYSDFIKIFVSLQSSVMYFLSRVYANIHNNNSRILIMTFGHLGRSFFFVPSEAAQAVFFLSDEI